MKTLILVRHAKSSWNDPSLSDFDRPLNERGKNDAPMMADRLLQRGIQPEIFLSSSAKRARKTAKVFAKAFGKKKKDLVVVDELYAAGSGTIAEELSKMPDDANIVALFAHNPGITDFANSLTHMIIDNIPTCGIFAVKIKADSWKEFADAEKEFLFFDFPQKDVRY